MKTKMLDIQTQDGICDCFVAYPEDKGQFPAVLFLMDAIGPREWLYEMAKTIAARGYYVLSPNVFYRMRRPPLVDLKFPLTAADMPEVMKQLGPLFQGFTADLGMRDVPAFLDFFAKQPQVLSGKIRVTGYCLGGRLAILTAAQFPDQVSAAASFHGGNLATENPDSPHLLLKQVQAELYIANADNDRSMPAEQIERLRSALDQAGVRYEMETYLGAAHGFTMQDLPAYQEAGLTRHWQKLFALFERSLKSA